MKITSKTSLHLMYNFLRLRVSHVYENLYYPNSVAYNNVIRRKSTKKQKDK